MIPRYAQFWLFRKGSGNNISIAFCVWLFRKKYFLLRSINWPNLMAWLPLLLEILVNMHCYCLLTRLWRYKFWNWLSHQAVFRHDSKFKTKNYTSWEREEYLRWKAFLTIFKGLSVSTNSLRLASASLMLWNSTSCSHLNLTVQIHLVFHPCDPFLINKRNMTDNIVEKCFAVWNAVQNVLLTLKPNI